jgi:beta-glucosidase
MTPTNTTDLKSDPAIQQKIADLMAQMTVEEKAGQLTQFFYFGHLRDLPPGDGFGSEQPLGVEAALAQGGAGSLLFVRDAAESNRLQRMAVGETRLGIPVLFGFDVVHGLHTILPVPIALAASWDPDLVERGQTVAARESRAVGIHWTFAPMLDIARDPRWGRIIEGSGEDPYLSAIMAAAQVHGFQGISLADPDRIVAGPKHYVGYGDSLGGRDYDEVNLSDYELHNVYLPPFQAAIDAGAANVMTAYMALNGVPATGNPWLLTEVLRDELGFDGWVVSDANAVRSLMTHEFAADLTDAGVRALNAGCDMEMAIFDPAFSRLPDALVEGRITEEQLDTSVRRILEVKHQLGLFNAPYVDEDRAAEVLGDASHRDIAREAAERCAVLLKNDGGLLPLDPAALASVAVIGPMADSRRDTLGPWCFAFDLDETITILDGLQAELGDSVQVTYAPGYRVPERPTQSIFDLFPGNRPVDPDDFDDAAEFDRAVQVAADADVAIVVVGEWQHMVGEQASRASLSLPGRQLELLQRVSETGTPVVVLVMNGRPLDLRWAAEHVPAILDVWYPGTRGGEAVANLLVGKAVPGGKLPFTWPRSAEHAPMIYSHLRSHDPDKQGERYWDEPSTPLFPFGHGLSYTTFEYGNLMLSADRIAVGQVLTVAVDITNTGAVAGDAVVQLYLHQRHGRAARPVRELKGFSRVHLEPGARTTVNFEVGPDELRYWHALERDWVIDTTTWDVYVGGDSTASLQATFETTE